jgi:hypothetical protein
MKRQAMAETAEAALAGKGGAVDASLKEMRLI